MKITNERQYRITKAAVARFEEALARGPNANRHPRAQQAMEDAARSQLDELRAELQAYEALRSGQGGTILIHTVDELPDALIQARVAAGLTQKQLAERLNIKEQQIQRYERTRYASASWTRLLEVASTLGIRLVEPTQLEVAPEQVWAAEVVRDSEPAAA